GTLVAITTRSPRAARASSSSTKRTPRASAIDVPPPCGSEVCDSWAPRLSQAAKSAHSRSRAATRPTQGGTWVGGSCLTCRMTAAVFLMALLVTDGGTTSDAGAGTAASALRARVRPGVGGAEETVEGPVEGPQTLAIQM